MDTDQLLRKSLSAFLTLTLRNRLAMWRGSYGYLMLKADSGNQTGKS